jgi:mRNA-degrading endonuclease toxin of MazEF toxin-antitoxin module
VNAWGVYFCDLGFGEHSVVVGSHTLRAANTPEVDVVACSSQRAGRHPQLHEVLLDEADGMDWPTLCKCDLIYTLPKVELRKHRGRVTPERRRTLVETSMRAHGWNAV